MTTTSADVCRCRVCFPLFDLIFFATYRYSASSHLHARTKITSRLVVSARLSSKYHQFDIHWIFPFFTQWKIMTFFFLRLLWLEDVGWSRRCTWIQRKDRLSVTNKSLGMKSIKNRWRETFTGKNFSAEEYFAWVGSERKLLTHRCIEKWHWLNYYNCKPAHCKS